MPDIAERTSEIIFNRMEFIFPIPFTEGDLVCRYHEQEFGIMTYAAGPFVFKKLILPEDEEYKRCNMISASGYFQNEFNSKLYYENIPNYMDLEFYRGELKNEHRVLQGLSNFIKSKIDVVSFANAYHKVLCETYAGEDFTFYQEKPGFVTLNEAHFRENK